MLRALREHWAWIVVPLVALAPAIAVAAWLRGSEPPRPGDYPL